MLKNQKDYQRIVMEVVLVGALGQHPLNLFLHLYHQGLCVCVCNIWCSNFLLVVGGFCPFCDCMQVLLTPPFIPIYLFLCLP